jgi:hypothetical protein
MINAWRELGVYETSGEGKRDTVTIFQADYDDAVLRPGGRSVELETTEWKAVEEVGRTLATARIVRFAIRLLAGPNGVPGESEGKE